MPRLRLIAGPNGSGKTTLMRELVRNRVPIGQYLNPDDIARHINLDQTLRGTAKALKETPSKKSPTKGFSEYFAALLAQSIVKGLRNDWLEYKLSLTYESVMSHESHLEFVKQAAAVGFDPYLYYICTSDPQINVARVQQRVSAGGHDVPAEKIEKRYERSLGLLHSMVLQCKRVYLFDNSGAEHLHFAEITPAGYLDIFEKNFNQINPNWFVENLLTKWDRK